MDITPELKGRAFKPGTSDKSSQFPKPHTSEKVRGTPGPTPEIGCVCYLICSTAPSIKYSQILPESKVFLEKLEAGSSTVIFPDPIQ